MIPVCEPYLAGKEKEYINDCLKTNWISSNGKYIEEFESKFAEYCNCKYGVSCTNGTTALHLALASIGIKPGDEVIIPDFTIASCAFAVSYCGAIPVFVDCDTKTLNIDVNRIEEKITSKTKAIMPVHIYGKPCEIMKIASIALDHNLHIIEDCAEAHGAEYIGKKVGSLSDVGCFSFYSNKLITTGEGGMLTTNSKEIADKARSMRNLSHSSTRFLHDDIGFNYRMTNYQAAMGLAQLENIDKYIDMRLEHARLYTSLLKGIKQITLNNETRDYVKSINWMFGILVEDRDNLSKYLMECGIQTRNFFIPMHRQPMYHKEEYDKLYWISDYVSNRGLYLPSGTGLKHADIAYICKMIKKYYS